MDPFTGGAMRLSSSDVGIKSPGLSAGEAVKRKRVVMQVSRERARIPLGPKMSGVWFTHAPNLVRVRSMSVRTASGSEASGMLSTSSIPSRAPTASGNSEANSGSRSA